MKPNLPISKKDSVQKALFRPDAGQFRAMDQSSYDEEDLGIENREEDDDSSLEEGELTEAQKKRLKSDLLMMGFDDEEDMDDAALIANHRAAFEHLQQPPSHALAAGATNYQLES